MAFMAPPCAPCNEIWLLGCQCDIFSVFPRSYNMRSTSGDARLANRLHVLQLRMLEPGLGVNALARRAGLAESTVRSILTRYGNTSIAVGAPPAKKGAGPPVKATDRDKRCAFVTFAENITASLLQTSANSYSKTSPDVSEAVSS